jgi:HAE1 family hydrophobic/amphiphilic exporter-1
MNNSGQKWRSQFVDFERIYGPAVSLNKNVNVNGKSNPGFSSGDAIGSRSCCTAFTKTYTYEFSDQKKL